MTPFCTRGPTCSASLVSNEVQKGGGCKPCRSNMQHEVSYRNINHLASLASKGIPAVRCLYFYKLQGPFTVSQAYRA